MADTPYLIAAMPSERAFDDAVAALERAGLDRAQVGALGPEERLPEVCRGEASSVGVETPDDRQQERVLFSSLAGTVAGLGGAAAAGAATGGLAVPMLIAALAAGGGAIGLSELFGAKHEDDHDAWAAEQVGRGGLVLFVTARDEAQRAEARRVIEAQGGSDLREGVRRA